MSKSLDQLKTEILMLPEEERLLLADFLTESLRPPVDPRIDAAWEAEVGRRVAEIRRGDDVLVDGEAVLREADAILNEKL